jgi:hypothetical protein
LWRHKSQIFYIFIVGFQEEETLAHKRQIKG